MGKKNPKNAETAGGRTPEINVKVPGDALDHDCKKGTKEVSYNRVSGIWEFQPVDTYRCQIGEDGYREQRDRVEETDRAQEYPTHGLLATNFTRRLVQILPDLAVCEASTFTKMKQDSRYPWDWVPG